MHIITETGATILLDGRPYFIPREHAHWDRIIEALNGVEDEVRRILNPAAFYKLGDRWRTREGSEAVIERIDGDKIVVMIDECFEVETVLGKAIDPNDDLIERVPCES